MTSRADAAGARHLLGLAPRGRPLERGSAIGSSPPHLPTSGDSGDDATAARTPRTLVALRRRRWGERGRATTSTLVRMVTSDDLRRAVRRSARASTRLHDESLRWRSAGTQHPFTGVSFRSIVVNSLAATPPGFEPLLRSGEAWCQSRRDSRAPGRGRIRQSAPRFRSTSPSSAITKGEESIDAPSGPVDDDASASAAGTRCSAVADGSRSPSVRPPWSSRRSAPPASGVPGRAPLVRAARRAPRAEPALDLGARCTGGRWSAGASPPA